MKSCIFTYILLLVIVGIKCKCPNYCICGDTSLKCKKQFPPTIPVNISSVTLFELPLDVDRNFSSAGWENITHLSLNIGDADVTINERTPGHIIKAGVFRSLKNLEYLQLHCNCFLTIAENAFHGLKNLNVLDLSNNNVKSPRMDIAPGLYGDDTLPNLSELYLSNVSTDKSQIFHLSNLHRKAKCMRFLKLLDVSNTSVTFHVWPHQSLFKQLKILNISRSGDAFLYFTKLFRQNRNARTSRFIDLQVLDASYAYFPKSISACKLDFLYKEFCRGKQSVFHTFLPLTLTELYLKNWFNSPVQLRGTPNATNLYILASYFSINITICISGRFNHLLTLDISSNSVTYLQPDLVHPFVGLKHLDISRNDLGEAIRSGNYAHSFFKALQHIKVLIMSHNNIINIPNGAFTKNSQLDVLDLSHNQLETLNFGLESLVSLKHLDVSFNNILHLDTASCTFLNALTFKDNNASNYYVNTSQNAIIGTYINFKGNSFTCSCDDTCLLNYIVKLNETYTCLLNGQLEVINDFTIRKAIYLCKEGIVIGTFSTLAVALVIICAVGTYLVIQEKRKITLKRLKETGIEMCAMSQNKRMVFLSFAGEDEDFIMTNVYTQLDSGLKAILNTDECCVATGFTDFRLGYYIKNEIVRCIEASSVVVLFLSDNFCRKTWCRDEVYKAFGEDKPIILMMWGMVDTNIMPKVLRRHYEKNTRVHWMIENGEPVMRPGWNRVCEDIVRLIGRQK